MSRHIVCDDGQGRTNVQIDSKTEERRAKDT
jgi:hypothetical protein